MKIKEGGVMDVQKEMAQYENILSSLGYGHRSLSKSDLGYLNPITQFGFEIWYESQKAAKAQAVPEGFALVSQKDLLELTIAINAVDLATHTESKTNEVREMWQQVALKLMALGTTQEPK